MSTTSSVEGITVALRIAVISLGLFVQYRQAVVAAEEGGGKRC